MQHEQMPAVIHDHNHDSRAALVGLDFGGFGDLFGDTERQRLPAGQIGLHIRDGCGGSEHQGSHQTRQNRFHLLLLWIKAGSQKPPPARVMFGGLR
jgi:hypothetical protein